MFKAGGGVEVLKTCHIERNEKSCISGLTNILRFYPTVNKDCVDFRLFTKHASLSIKKLYKNRGKIWYFIKN